MDWERLPSTVVIQVLKYLPISDVITLTSTLHKKEWLSASEICRFTDFEEAYGTPDEEICQYLSSCGRHIKALNLNYVTWWSGRVLHHCKNVQELHLLDCSLPAQCSWEWILTKFVCLRSLSISLCGNNLSRPLPSNLNKLALKTLQQLEKMCVILNECTNLFHFTSNIKCLTLIYRNRVLEQADKMLLRLLGRTGKHQLHELYLVNIRGDSTVTYHDHLLVFGKSLQDCIGLNKGLGISCDWNLHPMYNFSHYRDFFKNGRFVVDSIKELKELSTEHCTVGSQKVLQHLSECVKLEKLTLNSWGKQLQEYDTSAIGHIAEHCSSLTAIDFTNYHIANLKQGTRNVIDILCKVKGLKCLGLCPCAILCSGKRVSGISKCPGYGVKKRRLAAQVSQPSCCLEKLVTSCPLMEEFTCSSIDALGGNNFSQSHAVREDEFEPIKGWSRLKKLCLNNLYVFLNPQPLLTIIGTCSNLTSLELSNVGPTGASVLINKLVENGFQYCTSLKDLRICQANLPLKPSLFLALTGCVRLERLCIQTRGSGGQFEGKNVENICDHLAGMIDKMPRLAILVIQNDDKANKLNQIQRILSARYKETRSITSKGLHFLNNDVDPFFKIPYKHFTELVSPRNSWGRPGHWTFKYKY